MLEAYKRGILRVVWITKDWPAECGRAFQESGLVPEDSSQKKEFWVNLCGSEAGVLKWGRFCLSRGIWLRLGEGCYWHLVTDLGAAQHPILHSAVSTASITQSQRSVVLELRNKGLVWGVMKCRWGTEACIFNVISTPARKKQIWIQI